MKRLLVFVVLLMGQVSLGFGETADQVYEKASEAMESALAGDSDQVVKAATLFKKASLLYEKESNEEGVQKSNAALYWCKKRMTNEQIDMLLLVQKKNDPARVETTFKKIPKEKASEHFKRAQAYAKKYPKDHFAIAVQYYEVADRFVGTDVSLKAQQLSLESMQKVLKKPAQEEKKKPEPEVVKVNPKPRAKSNLIVTVSSRGLSSVIELKEGQRVVGNRNYQFKKVPDEYRGLDFTQMNGNAKRDLVVTVPAGATVYAFFHLKHAESNYNQFLSKGWEKGDDIVVTKGPLLTLKRTFRRSERVTFPGVGFYGVPIASDNLVKK